jgi:hypothetical protein
MKQRALYPVVCGLYYISQAAYRAFDWLDGIRMRESLDKK